MGFFDQRKNVDLLNQVYRATGSDNSNVFLELYREKYPSADLLRLDAVNMETAF